MKIEKIEIRILEPKDHELKDLDFAMGYRFPKVDYGTWVRVTADGIKGHHCLLTPSSRGFADFLELISRHYIGKDPFTILSELWKEYKFERFVPHNYIPSMAIGVMNNAIWDIKGKAVGKPIYELIGGRKKKLKIYKTLGLGMSATPEDYAEKTEEAYSEGYRGVKIFTCGNYSQDLRNIEAIINTGLKLDVMLQACAFYDEHTAKFVAEKMDQLGAYSLGDPIDIDNIPGYLRIKKRLKKLYIAGAGTHFGFYRIKNLIDSNALDIIRSDANIAGGIDQAHRIAQYAEENGKLFIPHTFNHLLSLADNLHVAAATSNCPYVEVPHMEGRDEYINLGVNKGLNIRVKEGKVEPPKGPGLGIDIDWESLDKYVVYSKTIDST